MRNVLNEALNLSGAFPEGTCYRWSTARVQAGQLSRHHPDKNFWFTVDTHHKRGKRSEDSFDLQAVQELTGQRRLSHSNSPMDPEEVLATCLFDPVQSGFNLPPAAVAKIMIVEVAV